MNNSNNDTLNDQTNMIKEITEMGILNPKVIHAMAQVPRQEFVPLMLKKHAFLNEPLPIGQQQTISQPYIVAKMCELLDLQGDENVLEIGTGSGYQAAILSQICKQVYTIEIIPSLADNARKVLKNLNYNNVTVFLEDGKKGLPGKAPFDAIICAAVAKEIPETWKNQLAPNGVIVCPVYINDFQQIILLKKTKHGFIKEAHDLVSFVPLT